MNALLVTGYSSFDLGIFDEKDLKITVIKKAIRKRLTSYLENGLEWVVFTGAMGFEYWALEVAKALQAEYPFQISTIFDFETHGQNWNESNQTKLSAFKNVDFIKFAYQKYENPQQFRQYNEFLLENTEGAFVFYDVENETKLHYLVEKMETIPEYDLDLLTFEDLQDIYEEMNEE
ncbi:DUF1273 domain-containing protein [Lactococcus fujiensis]|uniref:UPF0398 protein RT41_GL001248 n=1 Tax=Lactococcus fujiensis JCM 16395 TaxID=1291764 RepID=A0A2A5RM13_9LACT|nr:DUF1273 domain-containing protein [Lactococcus fujiensis]PCS00361.1 hypothetical protein RT41_GL001248 [Lactococcus fujiensis JCM 16395]